MERELRKSEYGMRRIIKSAMVRDMSTQWLRVDHVSLSRISCFLEAELLWMGVGFNHQYYSTASLRRTFWMQVFSGNPNHALGSGGRD